MKEIEMSLQDTAKAIADPIRREILMHLKKNNLSAGEIAGCFDVSWATVSYHLAQLKKADLITETRHKNYIYYELNASVIEELMIWLSEIGGPSDEE